MTLFATILLLALVPLGLEAQVAGASHPCHPEDPDGCSHGPTLCVVVLDFPDLGYAVCVDLANPNCLVYEVRTSVTGTERRCLVPP